MGSGLVRQFHLKVLVAVAGGVVSRGDDFEYHLQARGRHVSEAVYLLENVGYVLLGTDGTVGLTRDGALYLVKRGVVLDEVPVG